MKDKILYLETSTKKYPFIFNLNVMEEIQDEYGSVEKWTEAVDTKPEPNVKALKFGLTKMINEAIDIENEKLTKKREFVSEKETGRLLTDVGLSHSATSILQAMKTATDTGKPKNASSTRHRAAR